MADGTGHEGSDWRKMGTAPKDGTVIELTWMEDGAPQEIHQMLWDPGMSNSLVQSHVGIWTAPSGAYTWSESREDGAPTHWRPLRRKV